MGDTPINAWDTDSDQLEFAGLSEVLFLHKGSHTVILDDLVQRNPILNGKSLTNFIFKLAGAQYPDGGVPLDMKMAFLNCSLARRSLEKLLSWGFDRLIIAHGACIESGAKQYVERAFRWLEKWKLRSTALAADLTVGQVPWLACSPGKPWCSPVGRLFRLTKEGVGCIMSS